MTPLAAAQQHCLLHRLPLVQAPALVEARNAEADARTEQAERQHAAWQTMIDAARSTFPVWKYTNPRDTRSRPDHAARDGNYYPSTVRFVDVRGLSDEDLYNCRCVPVALTKYEWAALKARGARLADGYVEPDTSSLPPTINTPSPARLALDFMGRDLPDDKRGVFDSLIAQLFGLLSGLPEPDNADRV